MDRKKFTKAFSATASASAAALLFFSAILLKPSYSYAEDATYKKWSVSGSAGWLTKEGDEETYGGQLYDLSVGYRFKPRWSTGLSLGHNPFLENDDENLKQGHYVGETWTLRPAMDLSYHLSDPGARLDPYISAWAGAQYSDQKIKENNWNAIYGPGVGVLYALNDKWSARGDYRLSLTGNDPRVDNAFLVGLTYNFNGLSDESGASQQAAESPFDQKNTMKLQPIYFKFDSSSLNKDSKQKLGDNANYLKQNPSKKATLEGHCDERGTNEYNMALGQRRARSAFDYLRSLGIPAEQMSTVSFGEENPADPGHNEAAWAKNRRVETVVPK